MSTHNIGDTLVRKPAADGACVQEAVIVSNADEHGWLTYEVTQVRPDRSGYAVGERRQIHRHDIPKFYTVTPALIAQEATTVFTTTITKSVPKTIDCAVGDVFHHAWGGESTLYRVVEVDPTAKVGQTIKAEWRNGNGETLSMHFSLGNFHACTHLRPEGAPVTTVDVDESTTYEHKFAVGDVIQYTGTHAFNTRPQTITSIGFRPQGNAIGEPFYFYDGDTEGGDRVVNVDNHSYYGAVLVGGPRFDAEQAAKLTALQALVQARDLITAPSTWIKGSYVSGGAFCSVGAIQEATRDAKGKPIHGVRSAALLALAKVVRPDNYDPEGAVITFNDDDDTTHEVVLAAFDKTIADLRYAELVAS